MATLYDYFLQIDNNLPDVVLQDTTWIRMETEEGDEEIDLEEWDDGVEEEKPKKKEEEKSKRKEEEEDFAKKAEEEEDFYADDMRELMIMEGFLEEEQDNEEEMEVVVVSVDRGTQTEEHLCECPFCPVGL